MNIVEGNGKAERKILAGMATSTPVLSRIASRWTPQGLFASPWANLVGSWCVDYFRKHEQAPNKDIESLFTTWAEQSPDESTIKLVETFLDGVSREYTLDTAANPDYLIDEAGIHFNRVKIESLSSKAISLSQSGKVEEALAKISSFNRVELGVGAGVDLFLDKEAVYSTFERVEDPLITYPGALGRFFHQVLQRDRFFAFMAPEKTGKSFCLLDIAWTGLMQRRRVAYFQVGDLSEDEIKLRFMVRAAQVPDESEDGKWPFTLDYPVKIDYPRGAEIALVENESKTFPKAINPRIAWRACERVMLEKVKSKKSWFKLSTHPNSSINVQGIKSILEGWEQLGWIADIIIIDYADILAPETGRKTQDFRHQIDETWSQLRSLSQTKHCLVVTATQSNRDSYGKRLMDRRNISEEKRKLAHVTGMCAINVTDKEREAGIMRLNWLGKRQGKYSPLKCVHVAGCLALASPMICSTF